MLDDEMRIGSVKSDRAELFRDLLRAKHDGGKAPVTLEIGTLRWDPDFPTHHRAWVATDDYTMTDIAAGTDVDIVSDAHDLTRTFRNNHFDAVIAVSVWEHLRQPWVAMQSVFNVMRGGGLAYIATHQTFPIHGYPHDFFRFSDAAMTSMALDVGFTVVDVGYAYPAQIVPGVEIERWNTAAEAYLNVDLVVRKPGP